MVIGSMTWRWLALAHWAVDPEAVRHFVPEPLTLDTFGGAAFIGLVGLRVERARARFLPRLPLVNQWAQVNLRTYVTFGGVRGLWLMSMDAGSTPPVIGRRALLGAPYHRSQVTIGRVADGLRYRVHRRWPGPVPAELDVRCRVGRTLGEPKPGSLEEFLVDRYSAFTVRGGMVVDAPVRHRQPWLCMATLELVREELRAAAGLPPGDRLPDLFCRELAVDLLAPRLAPARRPELQPAPA
jgi:uncharacterized protein YqjF (DUF2071 family)